AKFYRPGRWSKEAILDEHRFLAELHDAEVPVVPPIARDDGATLGELPVDGGAIWFAVFPKARGRAPEELDDDKLLQLGRLIARLHTVGAARAAPARPRLDTDYYGETSLRILVTDDPMSGWVPHELRARFRAAARGILDATAAALAAVPPIRIHGDCHLGNLLWGADGPFFLDFDDFLHRPPVQDLWL